VQKIIRKRSDALLMSNKLLSNKKAYMFTLDLIIAIVVLIIGVAIIFYNFIQSNKTVYFTEQLSEDIVGVLSYTEINDLCSPNIDPALCSCPNYPQVERIVCSGRLLDTDTNMLSMMSEVIERGILPGDYVENATWEIFVNKSVIDEKRFGFALLYWSGSYHNVLELYNTETYTTP
jgi:hypothetical protein